MQTIICGISSNRTLYGETKKNSIKPLIQKTRERLITEFGSLNHDLNIYAGDRFNDDSDVIARLESANQEEIKRVGWEQAIRAALVDCMSADYYYTYEKEY